MNRWIAAIIVTLTIAAVTIAPTASAAPEGDITLTLIRHAQSTGNTSGFIDTTTPGPGLTDLGWQQAHQVAADYADDGFDGVFASTMTRTQQTAQFLADELHDPVEVLPGLREIEAGVLRGQTRVRRRGVLCRAQAVGARATALPAFRVRSTATSSTPGSTTPSQRSTRRATANPSRSRMAPPSRCGR